MDRLCILFELGEGYLVGKYYYLKLVLVKFDWAENITQKKYFSIHILQRDALVAADRWKTQERAYPQNSC